MRGFSISELAPTVPDREVVRHTHEEAHFVLVLGGAYVSGARFRCGLGERPPLVYNPPGTTHRDRFRRLDGRFFTLSVSSEALRRAAECVRLPDTPVLQGESALETAGRLARECRSEDASPLLIEALATELLDRCGTPLPRERGAPPRWLWRARQLLHDAAAEEVSLTALATAAGVHPVHLTRAFRRHFGCTPGDELRRCRLERAADLLAGGRLSLAEIAQRTGFADPSHLCRRFRQARGETPGAYRQRVAPRAARFAAFHAEGTSTT